MSQSDEIMEKLGEITKQLELIATILRISKKQDIENTRLDLEKDSVSREIIRAAKGIPYSELLETVAEKSGVSQRTVERRLAELRNMGIIVGEKTSGTVNLQLSKLLE